MSWTYDVTDLATSAKDQVRLLIGDVLASDPQMQDEEINFHISSRATVYGAAAECCRTLATKFSRSVDLAAGVSKASFAQLAKAYIGRTREFEAKAAMAGAATPYAGGISVTDLLNQQSNTDRLPPVFNIGMTDGQLPVPSAGNEPDPVPADMAGQHP